MYVKIPESSVCVPAILFEINMKSLIPSIYTSLMTMVSVDYNDCGFIAYHYFYRHRVLEDIQQTVVCGKAGRI